MGGSSAWRSGLVTSCLYAMALENVHVVVR